MAQDHSNDGFFRTSELLYDKVVITSADQTTSRVLLGASVSNINAGVTTAQQGLLVPSPTPTTLPALTATATLKGVPVAGVLFFWKLSCGSLVAIIDQNGVITRQSSGNDFSFNSNGGNSTGQIGSLVQVTATALRKDGSLSGCRGTVNVTIQGCAARQFSAYMAQGAVADNAPSSKGFYDLVSDVQPPSQNN
jgi:hypothetical protein